MKLKKIDVFGSEFNIKYVDKITSNKEDSSDDSFWCGLTDPVERTILVATKSNDGRLFSEYEIEDTLFHEVIHAVLTEGGYLRENGDEPLVEWLAKCLRTLKKQGLFK